MPPHTVTPEQLRGGGAPLLGEPLALEFVNTAYAERGVPKEGLGTPEQLARWLHDCRHRFRTRLPDEVLVGIDATDLGCVRMLRDASRRLIGALVRGEGPHPWDVARLNQACILNHSWPMLRWESGGHPEVSAMGTSGPLLEVQAELAHAVVQLLGGASGGRPVACGAPGCVLFFHRNSPRREWCSAVCGNRVRAARHYDRHHRAR